MKKKTIKIILIVIAVIVGLVVLEHIRLVSNSNKGTRTAPMEKINP
jgi:flagellar basal body-associated protein FliL